MSARGEELMRHAAETRIGERVESLRTQAGVANEAQGIIASVSKGDEITAILRIERASEEAVRNAALVMAGLLMKSIEIDGDD